MKLFMDKEAARYIYAWMIPGLWSPKRFRRGLSWISINATKWSASRCCTFPGVYLLLICLSFTIKTPDVFA
ncbi:MAG: hypothetical protein BWY09_00420 [Candidatus Hydrogenedentes bacterium ADurb.Bin179]|nr:MAG: hypothetical protein BWY09_00420 [Candidatus Hydrogenedentes bacterium ADurb.Bin179]